MRGAELNRRPQVAAGELHEQRIESDVDDPAPDDH
jgi:hypothetical protein